jgi:hypothetical protein
MKTSCRLLPTDKYVDNTILWHAKFIVVSGIGQLRLGADFIASSNRRFSPPRAFWSIKYPNATLFLFWFKCGWLQTKFALISINSDRTAVATLRTVSRMNGAIC